MLKVRTCISNSKIEGVGIFALDHITKGTVIWDFDPEHDRTYTPEAIELMDPLIKEFILRYAYLDGGVYILCIDNGKYMNHSTVPNTKNGNGHSTVATRDIWPWEEITCDYFEIDDDARRKLGK